MKTFHLNEISDIEKNNLHEYDKIKDVSSYSNSNSNKIEKMKTFNQEEIFSNN